METVVQDAGQSRSVPTASDDGARDATPLEGLRVRPTQQGTVYLWTLGTFTTFLLVFTEAHLAFLLGSIVLGCAGVSWFLARSNLRGLTFERSVPRHTRVGAPTPITWTVRSTRRASALGVEIEDRPSRGSRPIRLEAEFPVVAAGQQVAVRAEVRFARRGLVDLGETPAEVWSRVPLGLFRAAGRVRGGGVLLVRPREGRVTPRLQERLRGRRARAAQRRLHRGQDVIYGVREFREGDDPRRIHWRTTARRGTVTVSEWRAEHGREAVIVLGRGTGAGGRATDDFERAVSAVASIWRACIHAGLHAQLVLGDGRPVVAGEGHRGLGAGLDALARVPPQGNRKPRRALRRMAEASTPRTVVYVSAGRETGLEADVAAAAGRGGEALVIRAQPRALARWVGGLAP